MTYSFTPSPIVALAKSMQADLQAAIFGYLNTTLSKPVFDNVPQETPAPYFSLGFPISTPYETDGHIGLNILMPIHSWSEYHGKGEVLAMQREVYSSLHRAKLTITNYNCISILQENETMNLDPDGVTRHGIQQFRILIMSKTRYLSISDSLVIQ